MNEKELSAYIVQGTSIENQHQEKMELLKQVIKNIQKAAEDLCKVGDDIQPPTTQKWSHLSPVELKTLYNQTVQKRLIICEQIEKMKEERPNEIANDKAYLNLMKQRVKLTEEVCEMMDLLRTQDID